MPDFLAIYLCRAGILYLCRAPDLLHLLISIQVRPMHHDQGKRYDACSLSEVVVLHVNQFHQLLWNLRIWKASHGKDKSLQ